MNAAAYDFKITHFLFMTFCFHSFCPRHPALRLQLICDCSWNNVTWNIRKMIRILAHHTLFNLRGIFMQEDFSLRDWNIKKASPPASRSSEFKKRSPAYLPSDDVTGWICLQNFCKGPFLCPLMATKGKGVVPSIHVLWSSQQCASNFDRCIIIDIYAVGGSWSAHSCSCNNIIAIVVKSPGRAGRRGSG